MQLALSSQTCISSFRINKLNYVNVTDVVVRVFTLVTAKMNSTGLKSRKDQSLKRID